MCSKAINTSAKLNLGKPVHCQAGTSRLILISSASAFHLSTFEQIRRQDGASCLWQNVLDFELSMCKQVHCQDGLSCL